MHIYVVTLQTSDETQPRQSDNPKINSSESSMCRIIDNDLFICFPFTRWCYVYVVEATDIVVRALRTKYKFTHFVAVSTMMMMIWFSWWMDALVHQTNDGRISSNYYRFTVHTRWRRQMVPAIIKKKKCIHKPRNKVENTHTRTHTQRAKWCERSGCINVRANKKYVFDDTRYHNLEGNGWRKKCTKPMNRSRRRRRKKNTFSIYYYYFDPLHLCFVVLKSVDLVLEVERETIGSLVCLLSLAVRSRSPQCEILQQQQQKSIKNEIKGIHGETRLSSIPLNAVMNLS